MLNQIEVGKLNAALLARALGLRADYAHGRTFIYRGVACRIVEGKLIVPEGSEHLADALKQAYSREVIKYTAQRNGWKVTETRPNVFAVVK